MTEASRQYRKAIECLKRWWRSGFDDCVVSPHELAMLAEMQSVPPCNPMTVRFKCDGDLLTMKVWTYS